MSKNKKEKEIKQDDLKEQLKTVTKRHNESLKLREYNDEVVKRCLGAIEILQGLIEEESEENAEVRKEE